MQAINTVRPDVMLEARRKYTGLMAEIKPHITRLVSLDIQRADQLSEDDYKCLLCASQRLFNESFCLPVASEYKLLPEDDLKQIRAFFEWIYSLYN